MQHRHQLRAAGHRPHRRLGAGYERLRPHPQPTDQFWPFQFTEAGIFVALTTAALGATICCRAGGARQLPTPPRNAGAQPAACHQPRPSGPPRRNGSAPHSTDQLVMHGRSQPGTISPRRTERRLGERLSTELRVVDRLAAPVMVQRISLLFNLLLRWQIRTARRFCRRRGGWRAGGSSLRAGGRGLASRVSVRP